MLHLASLAQWIGKTFIIMLKWFCYVIVAFFLKLKQTTDKEGVNGILSTSINIVNQNNSWKLWETIRKYYISVEMNVTNCVLNLWSCILFAKLFIDGKTELPCPELVHEVNASNRSAYLFFTSCFKTNLPSLS